MKRIYRRRHVRDAQHLIRSVELTETYPGSQHWHVRIFPEGYGADPEPIEMGRNEDGFIVQEEGYGIFRIEHAHHIALSLTGALSWEEVA